MKQINEILISSIDEPEGSDREGDRKLLLSKEQIMEIIPHRDPFLLIDGILELEPGISVRAIKYVREEEYYFKGHFPQEKVMPGVLIVESLAQAGAVCILALEEHKGKIAYFGGIRDAKFRDKVEPGSELILEVTMDRVRTRAGTGIAAAYKGNKLACRCELMFMIG
jgi:3-hydroxyacyl-[acyl-carrier-protein] dehydratase